MLLLHLLAATRPLLGQGYHLSRCPNSRGHFSLQFVLKNTGKTPALNVFPDTRVYVPLRGITSYAKRQMEIADHLRNIPSGQGAFGFTIFPNDAITIATRISISRADAQGYIDWLVSQGAKDVHFVPTDIVGCISYRSVVDTDHHVTGFTFELQKVEPTDPGPTHYRAIEIDEDLPPDSLMLTLPLIGSGIIT